MSEELYVVPRFWDTKLIKFNEEGFEGWMIFGILGTFNFLYYSDIFAEKYLQSNEFDPTLAQYGGTGSAFFSQLGFKTLYGIGQWTRVFLNWISWFLVMIIWCLTIIPEYYIAEVWLFNIGAYFMGTLHLIRNAFLVIIWAIAIAVYDNYTSFYRVYDYFALSDAWGHRTQNVYSQTTGWQSVASERYWIDYELEFATCIGLFVGIPLLAPRYYVALKEVQKRKEANVNEYLNNERKWRAATLQKIAVKKAELKQVKDAERALNREKAAEIAARGAIDDEDKEDVEELNAEEDKEWL